MRIVGISDFNGGLFCLFESGSKVDSLSRLQLEIPWQGDAENHFGRAAVVQGEWYDGIPCSLVMGDRGAGVCRAWSDSDLWRLLNRVGSE